LDFDAVTTLTTLKTLNLVAPKAGVFLSSNVTRLTALTTLTLNMQRASSFPSLNGLSTLQTVSIYNTGGTVQNLPSNLFAGLSNLNTLNLQSVTGAGFSSLPSIASCTNLRTLDARQNNFTEIGDDFQSLTLLQTIRLFGNPYLSKLPPSLQHCINLSNLVVSATSLNQPDSFPLLNNTKIFNIQADACGIKIVPEGFCNLPASGSAGGITIRLNQNPIESFPACFFDNPRITVLSLSDTNLSAFPDALFSLSGMRYFDWTSNEHKITPIGRSLSFSGMPDLVSMLLLDTKIDADMPVDLSSVPNLESFNSRGNPLNGTLPSDFFAGTSYLTEFTVDGGKLHGAFPTVEPVKSTLQILSVAGNSFSSLPPALEQATNIQKLDFSDNLLTALPADSIWTNFASLSTLRLGGNIGITTTIPAFWLSSNVMAEVNISHCRFSGNVPPVNSSNLIYFFAQENQIDGTIGEFLYAPSLAQFNLSRNDLRGSIPSSLGRVDQRTSSWSLRVLDLSFNGLSGPVPTTLGNVSYLERLILNNNNLQGPIPGITMMGSLTVLRLNDNQFDLCTADPGVSQTGFTPSTCTLTNNLSPGSCYCSSYYDGFCATDSCPVPEDPQPSSVPPTAPTDVPTGTPTGAASSLQLSTLISTLILGLLVGLW
jgi:Leucine-rich repeat (LRR) protein